MRNYKLQSKLLNKLIILAVFCSPLFSHGYEIDTVSVEGIQYKDFVVGPGKVEVTLSPGQTKIVPIQITNRMGEEKTFSLNIEDFTGSKNPLETVVLLGQERGPYSLRDYISFAEREFTLKNGERATIPVRISLPTDAEPGGLYGSVIAETVSKNAGGGSGAAVVSRIGTLFFVRTPGEVKEEGRLADFSTKSGGTIFASGPIDFVVLYENTGSVYLNPYGKITLRNMLGDEVGSLELDPWFALPGAFRLREVSWDRGFLFGRYTATAEINRGYGDVIDQAEFSFWVIPWGLLALVFLGLVILILVVRFIFSKFEIRRK